MKKTNLISLISIMLLATLTLTTGCQTDKTVVTEHEGWHFIVVGDSRGKDTGVNTEILSEVVAEIVSNNPDFVLFPGDLITGSKDNEKHRAQLTNWRDIMQPVYDAKIMTGVPKINLPDWTFGTIFFPVHIQCLIMARRAKKT